MRSKRVSGGFRKAYISVFVGFKGSDVHYRGYEADLEIFRGMPGSFRGFSSGFRGVLVGFRRVSEALQEVWRESKGAYIF